MTAIFAVIRSFRAVSKKNKKIRDKLTNRISISFGIVRYKSTGNNKSIFITSLVW